MTAVTPLALVAPDWPATGRRFAFTVLAEAAGDRRPREALLDRAMGPGRRRKSSEALRRGRLPAEGLAFVARGPDGAVVGTVRLWSVAAGVRPDGQAVPALLLGPLAVDPAAAGAGIGSALMREAIAAARRRGHGAILLVGDPGYYRRFGFAAAPETLTMPGPFARERFLAIQLRDGWLSGAAGVLAATGRPAAGGVRPAEPALGEAA